MLKCGNCNSLLNSIDIVCNKCNKYVSKLYISDSDIGLKLNIQNEFVNFTHRVSIIRKIRNLVEKDEYTKLYNLASVLFDNKMDYHGLWCLERLVENNFTDAIYELGHRYLYGDKVEVNLDLSERLLLKAASFGDKESIYTLAFVYMELGDSKKQLHWIKKSAEGGDERAFPLLASMYQGLNNEKEAIRWFEKSARVGNTEANYYLGKIYMKNENINQSLENFEIAAKNYEIDAAYYIAQYYEKNNRCELANKWYEIEEKNRELKKVNP